jgi:hypothetical protein
LGLWFKTPLESAREFDEVGTNTEASTGASGNTHTWDVGIKDREDGGSGEGYESNFINVKRFFWDDVCSDSNHNTFYDVFYGAFYQFGEIKRLKHYNMLEEKKLKTNI